MMSNTFFHLSALLIASILVLYFVSIGRLILKRFVTDAPFVENSTLSFPLGVGAAATSVFLLGAIGQIRFWTFLILIALTGLLSSRETLSFLKELKEWMSTLPSRLSLVTTVFLFILFIHGLLNLVFSLAPPIDYDALNYHLVMAKHYTTTHLLSARPDIQWSFGPQLLEMLMTLGLTLHSDILASLLLLAVSFSLLGALYRLGRRFLSREVSLLAAMLFWCMPLVTHYVPLMKTDLGMTVFIVLGCDQWLWLSQRYSAKRVLLLSILLGLAFACKFTALPSIVVIAASTLWLFRKRWRERYTRGALLAGLFLLVTLCLPYLIRSYLLTGNPVYPNAYRIFGGHLWNTEMDKVFLARLVSTKSLMQFLTHPMQFSMGEIYGGHIGTPLFLAFLPLLFFWRPIATPVKKLLCGSFLIYALSYLSFDIHSRYYLPVLCLLSFPTAYVIQKIREARGMVCFVGFLSVALFVTFNLLATYAFTRDRIPTAFGIESRSSYLSRTLPYYPVIAYANEHTKPNDRFALLYTPGYYLKRDSMNATIYSAGIMFYTLKTAEKLAERLQALNIRYAILTEQPIDRRDWKLFNDLRQRGTFERIYGSGGYGFYRFHPPMTLTKSHEW